MKRLFEKFGNVWAGKTPDPPATDPPGDGGDPPPDPPE